jgi:hypothetical protein
VGQNTGFDDSEKTRFIDDASIGINDNPVVGEESTDRVCVIVGDRSREFPFAMSTVLLASYFRGTIQAPNEKELSYR